MITDALYNTQQTVTVGTVDDQYDVLKTNTLNSTTGGETINDFSSYWLGYISYTNVPMRCHPSIAYYDEDEGLHFEDVVDQANFPCGYCDDYYTDDTQYMDVLMQYTMDGETVTTTTNQIRLLNDNFPEYSGLNYNGGLFDDSEGVLHFMYAKYNAADEYQSGYVLSGADYTFSNVSPSYDRIKKMYDVIINDEEFSLEIEGETITGIKLSDFESGTPESLYTSESGDYKFRLFLMSCQIPHGCGINVNTRVNIAGTYMVKTSGAGGTIEMVRSLRGLNSQAVRGNDLEGTTQEEPYKIVWGCNGEFSAAGLEAVANYPAAGSGPVPYIYDGNVFVGRRSSSTSELEFRTLLFAEDVRRVFSLHYRVDTSSGLTPSYVKDVTYATDVNAETGEFYARLKTGDIKDTKFRNSLRPWQYTSFAEDDFEEEDIPGYQPGGGDPSKDPRDDEEKEYAPDKEDWGDPMNPNNGFQIIPELVNYKAFSAEGIDNFSERLWDAPDDFWEALTISNKNNANWLDYFISLRAYPYWINSTGEEANIYVGAGAKFYLGDEGTDLYASNPQHISFFVLNFNISKFYNNFLDFEPYTKAYVYFPFSGVWEVNPKYLYHTSLQILLKLDITDGSGVWQLIRSGIDTAGSGYIILEKQCKIGVEIPLSGLNATTMSSNIVNATLGIQSRALQNTPQIVGDGAPNVGWGVGAQVGGPIGAAVGGLADFALSAMKDSVNMANATREIPTHTGGMSGLAAANCNVIPSITLVRPIAENPDSFPHTVGHLVNKSATLSRLIGFTTCRNVDVSNVGQATDKEKAQLKKILENGFFA